jgi:hypothetical protein
MATKHKYSHALDRMLDLFKFGRCREKELESELAETKKKLYRMEQCYLDALDEIRELRDDLYQKLGSTGS